MRTSNPLGYFFLTSRLRSKKKRNETINTQKNVGSLFLCMVCPHVELTREMDL